ncbi:MAG: hypothetical protein R3257_05925, partial [bacterium]|nr:hypothetical protein [bacterium]
MGESMKTVQQILTNPLGFAISYFQEASVSEKPVEKQAQEDSFSKRPQIFELRRMESSQGKEEKKDKSITGL